MRRIILLLCAFLVLPLAIAHADTLLDFTLTGPSTLVTFTLPEHPFFADLPHLVTVGTNTSASLNGIPGYTLDISFFTGIADPGDSLMLDVSSSNPSLTGGLDLTLYGSPIISLYTGSDYPPPTGDITALLPTGHFDLTGYSSDGPIAYTLDITPETATTPEPSTIALLLTGVCTLFAIRRVAHTSGAPFMQSHRMIGHSSEARTRLSKEEPRIHEALPKPSTRN